MGNRNLLPPTKLPRGVSKTAAWRLPSTQTKKCSAWRKRANSENSDFSKKFYKEGRFGNGRPSLLSPAVIFSGHASVTVALGYISREYYKMSPWPNANCTIRPCRQSSMSSTGRMKKPYSVERTRDSSKYMQKGNTDWKRVV